MNNRRIKTRRQPSSQKGSKVLRAITKKEGRRRKHRAVANPAATFSEEGKNLGSKISSVLFILLLFHILVVGGIFIHNKWISSQTYQPEAPTLQSKLEKGALSLLTQEKTKLSQHDRYTWVNKGDTYLSIAARENVDVDALKKLNKKRPIKAGESLKVPNTTLVSTPETAPITQTPRVEIKPPVINRAIIVEDTPVASQITHTLSKGETLWALSKKYSVSLSSIQDANPNLNPNKISIGQKIKIPKS